ncbi:MAG: hypothetical protein Q9P14_03220 [candidate division KSB1 bacterium]|nr:hypothetical protein [candidate division KSB1 bacterium]
MDIASGRKQRGSMRISCKVLLTTRRLGWLILSILLSSDSVLAGSPVSIIHSSANRIVLKIQFEASVPRALQTGDISDSGELQWFTQPDSSRTLVWIRPFFREPTGKIR